jgi:alpha-tubulin suppressor-like RCC1 family protein
MHLIRVLHVLVTLPALAAGIIGASGDKGPTQLTLVAVSAGENHTCGITAAGVAYCWGFNISGQLGDGTLIARLTPVLVVQ